MPTKFVNVLETSKLRILVHYLDSVSYVHCSIRNIVCQSGLYAMHWSHIGILMRHLAAEPRSIARLLIPSQCPSGTILLTPYLMVWDWRVSRAGTMLFYWPMLLYPYYSLLLFFPFSIFFLSIGWYCGAGVFGLIGCSSISCK